MTDNGSIDLISTATALDSADLSPYENLAPLVTSPATSAAQAPQDFTAQQQQRQQHGAGNNTRVPISSAYGSTRYGLSGGAGYAGAAGHPSHPTMTVAAALSQLKEEQLRANAEGQQKREGHTAGTHQAARDQDASTSPATSSNPINPNSNPSNPSIQGSNPSNQGSNPSIYPSNAPGNPINASTYASTPSAQHTAAAARTARMSRAAAPAAPAASQRGSTPRTSAPRADARTDARMESARTDAHTDARTDKRTDTGTDTGTDKRTGKRSLAAAAEPSEQGGASVGMTHHDSSLWRCFLLCRNVC